MTIGSAVGLALVLASCAGTPVASRKGGRDNKYGVAPSPKVIPDGEPIPKGGGRAMVGQPYVVGGRTYVPTQGKGYEREGWASWYGTAFHGRLTANGEIFDRESVAAAHPTLPLPSYVRVTNLVNKRSMIVRVNDRGPYERDRLIDVSEAVAEALEFRRKGTTRVRVEYVGKASLAGSDDQKLLASLRTDGTPAPFGRTRGPTMLADLREEPPPRAAALAFRPAETAPSRPEPIRPASVQLTSADEPEDAAGEAIGPARTRVPPATSYPLGADTSRSPARFEPEMDAPGDTPMPHRRPAAIGGERLAAGAAGSSGRALPGVSAPIRAVELTPPQRPALAGIY